MHNADQLLTRIRELEAENQQLLDRLHAAWQEVKTEQRLSFRSQVASLEAENAAFRLDAERYQWLKHAPDECEWLKLGNLLPDQLDAAIDAALKS